MQPTSADQGAQKLALVLKPVIEESAKISREHVTVSTQEILLALGRVEARMEILEKLVSDKKKPATTRGEKKTTGAVDLTGAATPDTPVLPPPGAVKNFAVNKLVYFRDRFKNEAAYRAKYVSAELQELMDRDPVIMAKVKEEQKLVSQATYCWNYFKQNDLGTFSKIEEEYIEAKRAHEAAIKPPQQTAEAHTPPANGGQ